MSYLLQRGLLALSLLLSCAAQASDLPALNLDLQQTTVSGISSGAFMAVQMGVAKSSFIKGVAATAGGPYFCALDDSRAGLSVSNAIARCMQGDPAYPAQPITTQQLDKMEAAARDWARKGKIDPVDNLKNQAVWVFHGYNDGIVKLPVSQALVAWYSRFAPAAQVFHKDTLPAAHAQISAACDSTGSKTPGASCNVCATTGNKFINACSDQPASSTLYDAAGAALQMFYGPLKRTPTDKLGSKAQAFSQLPYLRQRDGQPVSKPDAIAMGSTGYVYVPQSCKAGQPCRLHIAFHGCMQSATTLGTTFVDKAGVNEWADANNIVVLYPQAMPTTGFGLPTNPMGCWDWWGYNDAQDATSLNPKTGYYATAEGVQIAAVWRMAEKLASKRTTLAPATAAIPQLGFVDKSATQAVLRWNKVNGATSYQVYRSSSTGSPVAIGKVTTQPFYVDSGLTPSTTYRYTVRPITANQAGPDSNSINVITAPRPPACDPYFSLMLNTPVKKSVFSPVGLPTSEVCK